MKDEHDLILVESEMFAIEDIVKEMHGFEVLKKQVDGLKDGLRKCMGIKWYSPGMMIEFKKLLNDS